MTGLSAEQRTAQAAALDAYAAAILRGHRAGLAYADPGEAGYCQGMAQRVLEGSAGYSAAQLDHLRDQTRALNAAALEAMARRVVRDREVELTVWASDARLVAEALDERIRDEEFGSADDMPLLAAAAARVAGALAEAGSAPARSLEAEAVAAGLPATTVGLPEVRVLAVEDELAS